MEITRKKGCQGKKHFMFLTSWKTKMLGRKGHYLREHGQGHHISGHCKKSFWHSRRHHATECSEESIMEKKRQQSIWNGWIWAIVKCRNNFEIQICTKTHLINRVQATHTWTFPNTRIPIFIWSKMTRNKYNKYIQYISITYIDTWPKILVI